MSEVVEKTKLALRATFGLYFLAHSCHWNVEGPEFPEYHSFFGKIYEDALSGVDGLAEQLRVLGERAPRTIAEINGFAGEAPASNPDAMIRALYEANDATIEALNFANAASIAAGKAGLSNFLQGRIEGHQKWSWMLRATGS